MRRLIVNADDFGFTRDVNDGILAAHTQGILTATTLMANGAAFTHAVECAAAVPTLDIGAHLVLIGGQSLLSGRPYPRTVAQLVGELWRGAWDVRAELRAQIERILEAGVRITHLDTHKHTHLHPLVLEAVAQLAEEYRIRWVRRPFDFPMAGGPVPWGRRIAGAAMGFLRPRFHDVLTRHGCRTTDHFAGFALTGAYRVEDFIRLVQELPPGTTEFMAHPGFFREELAASSTRLKESREVELRVLVHPQAAEVLRREGVALTGYRSL